MNKITHFKLDDFFTSFLHVLTLSFKDNKP